ncbi:hypothetical protein GSI_13689 [Ganoderma sinense ZZ0214-1]|uniref:Uncharacterized protein n=1 Tax=Ganoderma sinense ZZ0214-1 TaxID=1077348 RepID=A0A2G8RRH3_9APHY|nr:hypothetical protein GSI_13689 [Ganoderma sinense ZZ0214-1]
MFAMHDTRHSRTGRVDCSECESKGFPCVDIADNTDNGTTTPTQRDYSSTSGTVNSNVLAMDTLPPTDQPDTSHQIAPPDQDYPPAFPTYTNPFAVSEETDIPPYAAHPYFPSDLTYEVVQSPSTYASLDTRSDSSMINSASGIPANLTISTTPSPPLPPVTSVNLPSPICPVPLRSPGWPIPVLQEIPRSPTPPQVTFPSFPPSMPVIAGNAFYGYLPQLPLNCTSDVASFQASLTSSHGNTASMPHLLPLNEHVRISQRRERNQARDLRLRPQLGNNDQWPSAYTLSGSGHDTSQMGSPTTMNSNIANVPTNPLAPVASAHAINQPIHPQANYTHLPDYIYQFSDPSQSTFAQARTYDDNETAFDGNVLHDWGRGL